MGKIIRQSGVTMTFEEWLEEEAKNVEFDPGDSLEKYLRLGKKVLIE